MKAIIKKIIAVILIITLLIYILFTIFAFTESWKTGMFWIISVISLLLVVGYFIPNNTKPLSVKGTISSAIFSVVFFFIGLSFFELSPSTKKAVSEKRALETKMALLNIDTSTKIKETKDIPKIEIEKLKAFQKKWSNGLVKEMKGLMYVGTVLNLPDSISFKLSVDETKHFQQNKIDNIKYLQEDYQDSIISTLGEDYANYPVVIDLIPDKKYADFESKQNERNKKIGLQFSAWNGENVYVKKYIKQNMNDPDSYEHVNTSYSDKGSYILVRTEFRGKNAFGAKVKNVAYSKVDLDGNVLSFNLN